MRPVPSTTIHAQLTAAVVFRVEGLASAANATNYAAKVEMTFLQPDEGPWSVSSSTRRLTSTVRYSKRAPAALENRTARLQRLPHGLSTQEPLNPKP